MSRTTGGSEQPFLFVRSDTCGAISDPILQLQEHAAVDPLLAPDGCCMETSGGSYLSCPMMFFDVGATFLWTPIEQQSAKNANERAWYDGRRKSRIQTFMHLPFSFALVEIDKLVAPQRSVNLDYVERLQVAFRDKTSLSELISICLSPVREMPPIQHLEVANNTHMFSSPNTDLRFLGAFFKKLRPEDLQFAELGGIPAAAIITFIGYGGAPVNVFRWENRLVLNNGFHRLFALRSLGVTSVPVVVQHVQNIQLEFPSIVGGLPREYLLGVARPVLMKDFFEDGFCVTLNAKRRVRGISVQAAVGQFDVPS